VRIKHVDAFSRIQSIGIVEANSLEANLVLPSNTTQVPLAESNKTLHTEH